MDNFEIKIIGQRNDDGSGSIRWLHQTLKGVKYGDYVELENFDDDWMHAVREIAVQAAYTLDAIYSVDPEREERYEPQK